MAIFQIPDQYYPGFEVLSELDLEQVKKIVALLNTMPVGANATSFTDLLTKSIKIKRSDELSEAIFSLGSFLLQEDYTIQKVAKELTVAFSERSEGNFDTQKLEELEVKLLHIFTHQGTFKRTLKAISLLSENLRIYRQSKVLSDIRLIFEEDLKVKDRVAVIVHQLKIEYHETEAIKDIFISLDSNGLLDLKKQIDRAIEKEDLIKENYKGVIEFIKIQAEQ